MKILKVVSNDEKRDIVKAGNAVTPFKDLKGEVVKMTGLVIGEKTEVDVDTGEEISKEVTAIKLDDGSFISTISPTVKNSLENITEAFTDEEILAGIDVEIKTGTSNGGREFIYLDLA